MTPGAAQAMLAQGVRVLAGGTWVVPEMGAGRMRATRIVDLRHCGLDTIEREGDTVVIGAKASYAQLLGSELIAELAPIVATMAAGITGGWQLIYQGTLGGAACYATPTSDAPALLVALDAQLRLLGPGGIRTVPASDFFLGAFQTAAVSDELLVAIVIPGPKSRGGHGYFKVKRGDSSWPIATAACVLEADESGVHTARLALGGVSSTPVSIEVKDLIASGSPSSSWAGRLDERVGQALTDPWSDVLADAAYRRHVAGVLAHRAVVAAVDDLERAGAT